MTNENLVGNQIIDLIDFFRILRVPSPILKIYTNTYTDILHYSLFKWLVHLNTRIQLFQIVQMTYNSA